MRLTVTTAMRSPEGDGAIDERLGEVGPLAVGREVAAVVGRALLVAERLEAILQVAVERLIELVLVHPQRFFVRILAAADDALAQREQELPDAFLAELRLDELEDRVAEVVDQARRPAAAVLLELGHPRDDVGDRRVADRHQVERFPLPALVVREPLVHPQRHAAADQPLRDDVELELVRQLVDDQAVEPVGRIVNRQDDALAEGLGEGADAFGRRAGDVLLLEFAVRLEDDQRDLGRQVVLQIRADLLVGAFGVARDALEMLLDRLVVVDLEVIRRVDGPLERVVVDAVLAEIRHHLCLSRGEARVTANQGEKCGDQAGG